MVGHIVCTNIQNGADPMMGMSVIERGTYGPAAVDAARHTNCAQVVKARSGAVGSAAVG
jgi:hypothetical protein